MNKELRILLPKRGTFLDFEFRKEYVRASRSIEEKDSRDLTEIINNNVTYFSSLFHNALERKKEIVECEVSLIHYLKTDASVSEYKNTMLFESENDFHYWNVVRSENEQTNNTVLAFVMMRDTRLPCSQEKLSYLNQYYSSNLKTKKHLMYFYVPLPLIRSVVFRDNL